MKYSLLFLCAIGVIIPIVMSTEHDYEEDELNINQYYSASNEKCVKPVYQGIQSQTCSKSNCRNCAGYHMRREFEDDKGNQCQDEPIDTCNETMLFRKPEFIWGKDINTTLTKVVCESVVYARGAKIVNIHFTKKGIEMCSRVCGKQDKNILRVEPTTVFLTDHYCTRTRMKAATCICVYKVTCKELVHYAFIHIIPDNTGHVAISYFEAGHPLYTPLP